MGLPIIRLITIVLLFSITYFYSANAWIGVGSSEIKLNYLFKPGCLKCIKVEKQLVSLKKKYSYLIIKKYNVTDTGNLNSIISLLEQYSVPEDQGFLTPAVFIGNHYYIKNAISIKKIEQDIKKSLTKSIPSLHLKKLNKNGTDAKVYFPEQALKKLNSFSYLTVLLAGLIDGVNPCAFALLIFFLSYLKIAGKTGKQLVVVGLVYSISVFVTYFLIGLGFFHGLKMVIAKYSYIGAGVYIFSGLLALLCAALSLWDIYLLRTGKNMQKIILQLNEKTKKLTHKLIRNIAKPIFISKGSVSKFRLPPTLSELWRTWTLPVQFQKIDRFKYNYRNSYIVAGAIVIAVGVSFLELGCTGQIYLPVISFIVQQKIISSKALGLLLIYNAAFLLPLLLIFALTVLGMTHLKLSKWLQNNLIKIKLVTAIFFLFLGVVIFVQILLR
jgi:cytochrome c biogenesis protein CcdA